MNGLIQRGYMLFNDGVMHLHLVPAFPAFSNPFVPLKVIVINMDLAKSLDGKIKCCSGNPPFPTQHHATDSCHTILCTKCHLSYYKFSAEYSADPMGLRTKREHWQGHLWNAKRELPQSLRCEAVSWPLRLWVRHRQLQLPTMPQKDDCRCVPLHPVYAVSHAGAWFVSLNGINALVTFRQPWHNCAINVTDSFAGSSWLVLNHNYITVCSEDIQCSGMLLLHFVLMMMQKNTFFKLAA